jgi:hypothetical protein
VLPVLFGLSCAPAGAPGDLPGLTDGEDTEVSELYTDDQGTGSDTDDGLEDGEPRLICSPDRLTLTLSEARGELTVQLVGGGVEAYTVASDQAWLLVAPAQGDNGGEVDVITVTADGAGLIPGEYDGEIAVATGTGLEQTVSVTLAIDPDECGSRQIAGRLSLDGTALVGVLVSAGSGMTTVSDEAGCYRLDVPCGWSGEVAPRDVNYEFSPECLAFTDVAVDSHGNDFDAARLAPAIPMVGVRRASDGRLLRYQGEPVAGPVGPGFEYTATFDDENVTAELQWLGEDHWQLTLLAKVPVTQVWFPFELYEYVLNEDSSDDVFYTTRLCGDVWKSDALDESFHGPLYPGAAFAPLVVFADSRYAKMLAATNWPPRTVQPMYARGRMGLLYRVDAESGINEVPDVGETLTYGLLQTQASGDVARGIYAWHRTLERYRTWLQARGEAAGLFPVPYSDWMREIHGWMMVALHRRTDEELANGYLQDHWDRWKHVFPWMQMWGQMSDYDPVNGCCAPGPEIHPRHLPELVLFAEQATQEGHIGFYSRVREPYPPLDGSVPESQEYLDALLYWLDYNTEQAANAHYIDLFGVRYYGDALTIAEFFLTIFPRDAVIEYPVDVYPTAYYIANCIYGNGEYGAGPDYTDCPDCFDADNYRITFPRFGRYLLDDRIVFLGTGNDGYTFWGVDNEHWQERQVFLLGAKIDVHCGLVEDVPDSGEINHALGLIIEERDRVGWWARNPKYRDRAGVYDVPAGVEVRRFEDEDGAILFAIDNWHQHAGLTFSYDGERIAIPNRQLAIVEAP